MRPAVLGLAGAIFVLAGLPAAAQTTTRIESRPFYGAVITVEEGVRVFRPLPRHDRIVINPNNATPIGIGIDTPAYTRQVTPVQERK